MAAQDHIGAAADMLAAAGDEFDAESDQFGGAEDYVDFETGGIHDRIDSATTRLDEAETMASDAQRDRIEALQSFADWLAAATDGMASFGNALNDLETANQRFDNNRFEDAVASLDSALEDLDDADSHFTVARNEFESLDTDAIEDMDQVDHGEVLRAMADLETAVAAMDAFARGYRDLSRGFGSYFEAATAYDNERYEDAIEPFEEARNDFASAHNTFRDAEDDALPDMRSTFIEFTCLSGALRDGSDHFATAASAAADGDFDAASEAQQDAEEAMDRCE